ncbi:hypothetical protein [Kribbella sp. VKM Ac-2566]|uniref:hypothetical protein n=1 Tax=Kribbella sp. VKM Ac-2566 TaxID=2512218 RepID=UPI00106380BE|nr:hypothetical protein [Kribbella sp. VKM Ac-2566]TDX04027.1 hypothetical protein EV647_2284 [Kribbella sp. VKM Ac-2566]
MDAESTVALARDVPAVEAYLATTGGHLARRNDDPAGLYWVTIRPTNPAAAAFVARVAWSVYPHRPPSILFATAVGEPTGDPRGWPAAAGYRAPVDICKPFTAEGQNLHAEWATGTHAWRNNGNPFLYVVENLIDDINRVQGARAA